MQPKRIRVGARLGFRPPVSSLLVLFLAGTSAAQEFRGREHAVGGERGGLGVARTADLDGDGLPDAVAAVELASALAVFRGDGRGSFGAPSSFPCGESPRFVALGDLDGDGHVDALTIVDHAPGFVSRLLGDGAGSLGAPARFAAGVEPFAASLADLNGDGRLDVVTANWQPDSMHVLLANAAGGFAAPVSYLVGPWPQGKPAPAIADVNGDGALDVVLAGGSIFAGNGTGALTPAPGVANPYGSTAAAVCDVNVDGIVDLVGSSMAGSSGIVTMLGTGGGAFAPATFVPSNEWNYPEDLKVGDLDLDGLPDAVTYTGFWGYWELAGLWVFHNLGGGAFGVGVFLRQGGAHLVSIDLADLDLDGRLDVLLSDSNGIVVWRSDGQGGIESLSVLLMNFWTRSLDRADVNGDGAPDLIVTTVGYPPGIYVLFGDGAGGFGTPILTSYPDDPGDTVCADFDGDGQVDAARTVISFWGPENSGVQVMLGAKTGKFDLQPIVPLPASTHLLEVGDLNLDGRLDLVALGAIDFESFSAFALLSSGPKTFSAPQTLALEGWVEDVALLDADGDGILDLAATGQKSIEVQRGDGAGGFAGKLSVPTGEYPVKIRVADLNGDGRGDFVVSLAFVGGLDPRHLLVIPSTSSGFGPGTDLSLTTGGSWDMDSYGPSATAPWLGDLDGDGHVDIALPNDLLSNVCVLRGDGAGGFSEPSWFMAGKNGSQIMGADLDGDGVMDLVGANENTIEITVLRGLAGAPPGVTSFGAGTPGCAGTLGLSASMAPQVGAAGFGWKCTNAPESSVGLVIVGDAADLAGSDPLGLGVALHLDLFASTALFALPASSDAGGSAFAPAPIPNDPSLAGATLFAQALFVQPPWLACGPSPIGLVSSKGATIVIQP